MKSHITHLTITAAAAFIGTASHAETIFAVADVVGTQTLVQFDTAFPTLVTFVGPIAGLDAGESLFGMDYRPAAKVLVGVTSANRLMLIDRHDAAATPISTMPFPTSLMGSVFGFDFNPQIDRIRNVSDAGQNLVLNPISGALQLVATPVAYPAGDPNFGMTPNVVHHAYDNNVAAAAMTQLYAIDSNLDILVKQANNAGVLTTVGALGVDFSDIGTFDISGATGLAYAVSTATGPLGSSSLYSINLTTGAASPLGTVGVPLVSLVLVEAMTVLPAGCDADLNGDGMVDGADLGLLLSSWDTSNDAPDLNNDNTVNGDDLGALFASWGRCP